APRGKASRAARSTPQGKGPREWPSTGRASRTWCPIPRAKCARAARAPVAFSRRACPSCLSRALQSRALGARAPVEELARALERVGDADAADHVAETVPDEDRRDLVQAR